ncbi:MAG: hypothetical protein HW374_1780 [Bacteroidetes bacterium]|nr:hypothetical protein [Bacteroidota bacterium]
MNWHTISLPLIIVSALIYHLSQKSVPKEASPLVVILSAYIVALVTCIVLLLATGEIKKEMELLHKQNWTLVVLIGLTAVGVELGFLYAYRTGWNISTASITIGAFTTTTLALIGTLWFKEQLTPLNIVGVVPGGRSLHQ